MYLEDGSFSTRCHEAELFLAPALRVVITFIGLDFFCCAADWAADALASTRAGGDGLAARHSNTGRIPHRDQLSPLVGTLLCLEDAIVVIVMLQHKRSEMNVGADDSPWLRTGSHLGTSTRCLH